MVNKDVYNITSHANSTVYLIYIPDMQAGWDTSCRSQQGVPYCVPCWTFRCSEFDRCV